MSLYQIVIRTLLNPLHPFSIIDKWSLVVSQSLDSNKFLWSMSNVAISNSECGEENVVPKKQCTLLLSFAETQLADLKCRIACTCFDHLPFLIHIFTHMMTWRISNRGWYWSVAFALISSTMYCKIYFDSFYPRIEEKF